MTRIDSLNPLTTGRTASGQTSLAVDGADGSGGPQGSNGAGRQDVISLSDRGRVVAIAAGAVGSTRDVRAEKVAAIKASIANGAYSSNARDIAARLLTSGFGSE